MNDLREKLIKSINKTVDERQTLGADEIADGILEDLQLQKLVENNISLHNIGGSSNICTDTGEECKHNCSGLCRERC